MKILRSNAPFGYEFEFSKAPKATAAALVALDHRRSAGWHEKRAVGRLWCIKGPLSKFCIFRFLSQKFHPSRTMAALVGRGRSRKSHCAKTVAKQLFDEKTMDRWG